MPGWSGITESPRKEGGTVGVSREDVGRIAELARLCPDEESMARLTSELNRILDHVRLLGEVDISGIDESTRVTEGALPFRNPRTEPDRLTEGAPADRAPAWSEGFFSVPRIAALDGDSTPAEVG